MTDDCPYVGLGPFTREDERYFFGREVDSRVIANNFLTRPATILYGASGVGKSSVLNVGLPNALHDAFGDVHFEVRKDWTPEAEPPERWLTEQLRRVKKAPDRPLMLVLDQFEEYFLYRTEATHAAFESALAKALASREHETHLLISLRDDGLFLLDALRGRLSGLLDNRLELRHLATPDVHRAIEGPIGVYNREHKAPSRVRLAEGFADELIGQLEETISAISQRRAAPGGNFLIELPFLQLALQRLWKEMNERSRRNVRPERVLGPELLVNLARELPDGKKLNGVDAIVSDHLQEVFGTLNYGELALAAACFHYLVTPSGGKLAYAAGDLADQASKDAERKIDEPEVLALLTKLTGPKARILREADKRFLLFHDVLAKPVLRWCDEYLARGPFAFLTDVSMAQVYPLLGYGSLFGRAPRERRGVTPLAGRAVSRSQFLVLKSGQILDLRSRYGTTVNARPAHLADVEFVLNSGDVIGLNNTAAVVFHWPADWDRAVTADVEGGPAGWGLLIDGAARKLAALRGATLALNLSDKGGLNLSTRKGARSFATLEWKDGQAWITALLDVPQLMVVGRQDAYYDYERPLGRGERFEVGLRGIAPSIPDDATAEDLRALVRQISMADAEAAERGLFRIGEIPFEIILGAFPGTEMTRPSPQADVGRRRVARKRRATSH